ncbi:MAG: cytochrome o ubiquinol oxidase subunit IV [Comamonas sp.]|jgi:cytochrome o ubiquinol oxidase operon protein cyoD|nr:cytochrome o ubiquinol oxidase subunit IV [Comamonas sp.]
MSAHDIHAGHDDHHDHDDLHVTMGDYVKGFILAVILTAIPFYLVMNNVITDRSTAVAVLGLFAVVQVLVHMVYFLHMNGKIQGGWTMLSTIFTVIFLSIAIAGTLWVMFHMNTNMMPGHEMHQAAGHADHGAHMAPTAVTP